MIGHIMRLFHGALGANTLNVRTVQIMFQKSPGRPSGDTRGIDGLEFRAIAAGVVVQTGRTGSDGLISLRVPPGGVDLQLMWSGSPVATYRVVIRDQPVEAATTLTGQQRRLRMLGYQLGSTGPTRNGVDGVMGRRTDRAILDFQADQSMNTDGIVGNQTRTALTNEAGV